MTNRKYLLFIPSLLWSIATYVNCYAQDYKFLMVTKLLLSALQAFAAPPTYSLLSDLFPKEYKTKSFFIYSILTQLANTISLLTINLVSLVGWRMSFQICGIFGITSAILGLIFCYEPEREAPV